MLIRLGNSNLINDENDGNDAYSGWQLNQQSKYISSEIEFW